LCDACICNLNINSELTYNDMIPAISSASNTEKTSILVIEDIDCIFTDRKDFYDILYKKNNAQNNKNIYM